MTSGNDVERIAALHELPTFLPWEHIRDVVLPTIASTIVVLTSFYGTVMVLLVALSKDQTNRNDNVRKTSISKATYQLTNLVTNAVLGGLGLYYYYQLPLEADVVERITGLETELYLLACLQIGYQIWSLAVGILVVEETPAMLCHHVAVIIVATMSGVLTNGFRYHNPFFYGMLELSSIPLAVMNFFKDNPQLIETYPFQFTLVRIVFMITFLWIRIIMLLPRKYDYLWLCYHVAQTSDYVPLRIFLAFCWSSAFFLALLQIFWASLILKGFVKLLQGDGGKQKKKE